VEEELLTMGARCEKLATRSKTSRKKNKRVKIISEQVIRLSIEMAEEIVKKD
jgi:hypothetical protein